MITATEQKLRDGTVLWLAPRVCVWYRPDLGWFVMESFNLAGLRASLVYYATFEELREAAGGSLVGARETREIRA